MKKGWGVLGNSHSQMQDNGTFSQAVHKTIWFAKQL